MLKKLFLFEEFTNLTIKLNNSEYNKYLNNSKRSDIVAWTVQGSQEKNFNLIKPFIKNGDTLLDYGCGIGDLISFLKSNNINISDYLGVDINKNFIDLSKKSYPNNNFQLIKNVNDIKRKWDIISCIGVFTWYIGKDDFVNTIHKLYNICNKELLITCLYGNTYDYYKRKEGFWNSEYRKYNKKIFNDLFPNFNFEFFFSKEDNNTMLVRIVKK
jgi:cyclopropane fatty-acyl-phospholipid synthase-like methyltransferase